MTSHLFQPLQIGRLTLDNRIVIAPMCQYSARDGLAAGWHLIHYGHLALSGAGLLILEATAVAPEGRISPADLGLWSEDTEAALRHMLDGVRQHSAMPVAVQLAHAGRKASCAPPWQGGAQVAAGGWETVAPAAVPFAAGDRTPAALDAAGLARIRAAFVDAARRAARIGFDAVQVHAAHGYLLHQFLSPLANRRDDIYGGSLENRMRFPLEVVAAVREAYAGPLSVRLSATDWAAGGWDLEQTIVFADALKALGCDIIDVSTGGLTPAQEIPVAPGFQVPFAEEIRGATGLPTVAVGLITEPEQAERIVAAGQADMVALARGILYNPRWPWHAAAALGAQVRAPRQYWRSAPAAGLFDAKACDEK